MSVHNQITELWADFQTAIDNAHAEGQKANSADGHAEVNALADYTTHRNPWRLANLLGRESANERQHRQGAAYKFSIGDAAKLHLMNNAAYGATLATMPPAHLFLTMRQTAAEAEVMGFLMRKHITAEWLEKLATLDYAKLMETA